MAWGALAHSQDVYVDFGDEWRFFRGIEAPSDPGDLWRGATFDDNLWETGASGIGYGDGDDATVLDDMQGNYVTVYLRKTFNVAEPANVSRLTLAVDYDDGFIAYINGVEVARSNVTNPVDPLDPLVPVTFDMTADGNHEAGTVEFIELNVAIDQLLPGENQLAVEVHNTTLGSSDLSFNARLSANDPRADCPTDLVCENGADGARLSWTNVGVIDSIAISRDGQPIQGSPFSGDRSTVTHAAGAGQGGVYELVATIDGVACEPLTCTALPELTLVGSGEEWLFFRGVQAPSDPPEAWRARVFDDALWESGFTGIGYGDGDDVTVLDDMEDSYVTVYFRKTFQVADAAAITSLALEIDYDDGFVAYLNGTEVARSANMGAAGQEFAFDQTAPGGHEANGTEQFDISADRNLLEDGDNLLAVEGHNVTLSSSDFSFIPRLVADGCPVVQNLACIVDEDTGAVTLSWATGIAAESFTVTRNGDPLANSPFPGDTTSAVDDNPGVRDNTYVVTPTIGGFGCPAATCVVDCSDLDPDALTCELSVVDGATQAQLTWTPVAGATAIEVFREGALQTMLEPTATGYLDPDVESDEPEDDTDFAVVFDLGGGDTCTLTCANSLCPEDFACAAVDDGGVLRPQLTWTNMVKEWESVTIERDGVEVAVGLPGDTTSFFDDAVELSFGTSFTYTVVPVAPVGEEVGTACNLTCTVGAPIDEVGEYDAPAGGWDYRIDFSGLDPLQYSPDPGEAANLDGRWIRAVDRDSWDGSAPEEVGAAPDGIAPGGIEAITVEDAGACGGSIDALRILDPGNTTAPGGSLATQFPQAYNQPNNNSILLGLDSGVSDRNLLRSGVTFAARWRVNPTPPEYLNGQPSGDGSPLQGGVGQVGFYYRDADAALLEGATAGLAFSLESGDDMQISTVPLTELDAAQISSFRSIWVTVEDPDGDELYSVTVYLNGSEAPFETFTFMATALQGGTADFGQPVGNYLAIGTPGAGQDSDVQFDFVAYKEGVHPPAVTPCGPVDNTRPTARITASATTVRLAMGSASVTLDGGASDDGDGGSQGLSYRWTRIAGPATGDTIAQPDQQSTQVTFTAVGTFTYQLLVDDGQPALNTATARLDITVLPEDGGGGERFVRGDADSNGSINLTDGIVILNFLFLGQDPPACLDAADTDDDGGARPSLTDAVIVFAWLFSGGAPPSAPTPGGPNYGAADCGEDVTADSMDCARRANTCSP
ncbi:MAG: hypothetical protein O7J95_21500 [Planctomycetota bacterium]|nr:hypothetical protein [Planctomycetota bacterium]